MDKLFLDVFWDCWFAFVEVQRSWMHLSIAHASATMAPAAALVDTDAVALSDAAYDKAQKRKLNNRKSAMKSREREKQYLKKLLMSVEQLKAEIAALKMQKDSLHVDNTALSSVPPQPAKEACDAALQPKIYLFTESFLFSGIDN